MLNILRRSNSEGRKPFWLMVGCGSDSPDTTGAAWEAENLLSQPTLEEGWAMAGLVSTSSAAGGSFCASRKKHLCVCLHAGPCGEPGRQAAPSSLGLGALIKHILHCNAVIPAGGAVSSRKVRGRGTKEPEVCPSPYVCTDCSPAAPCLPVGCCARTSREQPLIYTAVKDAALIKPHSEPWMGQGDGGRE